MAKKGQKFNKYSKRYSKELRQIVISDVLNFGCSYCAKKYNIKKQTIESWYWSYKKRTLNKKPGPEGSRTLKYYKERYELIKKFHDFYNYQKRIK